MRSFRLMALLAMCLMLLAAPVQAKTTITFWHVLATLSRIRVVSSSI